MVAILSMISLSGKPLAAGNYDLEMTKLIDFSLAIHNISLYSGVLGITVSNLDGN